jgi:hypothetical protein
MSEFGATLPGAKRKRFCLVSEAALGETGEAGGVGTWRLRDADDSFIAGHLALFCEPAVDPDERGIQRKRDEAKLLL